MASSQGDLSCLPAELITSLYRTTGLKAALASLALNSRLHRTWQKSVDVLRIGRIKDQTDIDIIAKFVELKKLTLRGITGKPSASSTVGFLAPRLPLLKTLHIIHGYNPFSTLPTLVSSEALRTRLQDLALVSWGNLCPSHLAAIAELKGLSSLELGARSIARERAGESEEASRSESEGSSDRETDSDSDVGCRKEGGSRIERERQRDSQTAFSTESGSGSDSDIPLDAADIPDFNAALPALRKLKLYTIDLVESHLLSHFPGSMTNLTCLILNEQFHEDDELYYDDEPLTAAVSRLVNLQHLDTNYNIHHTATQHQALQRLRSLTKLEVYTGRRGARFAILDKLPSLRALDAPWASLGDEVLTHPSLTRLNAGSLLADASWRNRVADACLLEDLVFPNCSGLADDGSLANLPTLPRLRCFHVSKLPPSNDGQYPHLASFLHRHAAGLRDIRISLPAAFEHGLPFELPVCTRLAVGFGWHTLQVLSMFSLPQLEELAVNVYGDVDVEPDLGWLRGLPALKRVRVSGTAADKDVVRCWLAGRAVEVC